MIFYKKEKRKKSSWWPDLLDQKLVHKQSQLFKGRLAMLLLLLPIPTATHGVRPLLALCGSFNHHGKDGGESCPQDKVGLEHSYNLKG